MRVGLDARCLNREHLRGMGRYVSEVVRRTAVPGNVEWHLFADRPDLPLHRPVVEGVTVHLFELRGYRLHSWEQLALPLRARKSGVDVLHCPATRLPWWQPVPTVVTVHDTLPWTRHEPDWPHGWYLERLLPRALQKCAAIITDSENSRRDILALWPDLASKVHVIPLGVADNYLSAAGEPLDESLQALGIRQPYFLYLGGRIPRKRLDWALRVLEGLREPAVSLAICGVEAGAEADIWESVTPELRPRLRFVPFVSEEAMARLYQNALAVLYPTLYEGFGFPVVEAQAVGVPVVCSDVGSLTELKGPGVVMLPVHDLNAWIEACRTIAAERSRTRVLNEQARAWARRFSWDRCAARHGEIYGLAAKRRFSRRACPPCESVDLAGELARRASTAAK